MLKKEYHDFLYQYDEIDGYHVFRKDDNQCPPTFFKYYALTDYNVEALTNMYLYATHPNQLNDPLDCAEELIEFDNIDVIRSFWDPLFPTIFSLCNGKEEAIKEFTRKAYKTYLYMKCGILSLSTNCLDIPMWSAYTNHNGFCIELDFSDFPCKTVGPYPINYLEKLESIGVNKTTIQLATIIQTNIKNCCWKHENEWRLLLECPADFYMEPFGYLSTELKKAYPDYHDRKFKYPMRCLKSICLGMNFFNETCSVITNYEKEYKTNDKRKNAILSFLALSKKPSYFLDTDRLKVVKVPIYVSQIGNNTYHIHY